MVAAFYALQDTKTPVKVAFVAFLINLVASLVLMGPLKHGGIALALSLSSSIQFCLLAFFLKRRVDNFNLIPVLLSALKCAVSAVVMGTGVLLLYSRFLGGNLGQGLWHVIFNLGGLIAAGVMIYFVVARILGCRELSSVMDIFRSPFKTGKG